METCCKISLLGIMKMHAETENGMPTIFGAWINTRTKDGFKRRVFFDLSYNGQDWGFATHGAHVYGVPTMKAHTGCAFDATNPRHLQPSLADVPSELYSATTAPCIIDTMQRIWEASPEYNARIIEDDDACPDDGPDEPAIHTDGDALEWNECGTGDASSSSSDEEEEKEHTLCRMLTGQ
jgi:hypothetical protein